MSANKILSKDTRCCECHETMKAGEMFRWGTKKIYSSGKVTDFGKSVYRPAHVDPACVLRKFERICRDQDERNMKHIESQMGK